MSISILTDSTCDLPEEVIQKYQIEVVPLFIQMGEKQLVDGMNITKEEFYARLPDYDPAPTTASPGPDIFKEAYRRLAAQGAETILSLHISEALSATIKSARMAAQEMDRVAVQVIDSGQLSLGLGFMVERVAQMAHRGASLEEIQHEIKEMQSRTYVFAALDTLEYLRRSGRMHIALARFGEILQLKALLYMHQGRPEAHRIRTTKKAMHKMFSWLEHRAPFEKLAVLHAGVYDRAKALREQVQKYLPREEIPITQITPVLGAHLGVGALGFACMSQTKR